MSGGQVCTIIHFVDFEEAFNLVHRESLWSIMQSYGIPCKMVRVIADIYEGFECAVIDRSETSDWFKIKSGVKQGCVMSGFLFLLALDWIMRKVTADKRRGIRWNFKTVLEDLDFADNIALLSSEFNDLHKKTGRLIEEVARVGLKLNVRKCKRLRTDLCHLNYSLVWHSLLPSDFHDPSQALALETIQFAFVSLCDLPRFTAIWQDRSN